MANKVFGKKKRSLSALPIVFTSILGAGALAGTGLGVWQVARNYSESPEFTKSVNAKVTIDPFVGSPDDERTNKDIAEKNAKETAKRLSKWLKTSMLSNYDVGYEVSAEPVEVAEGKEQYVAYLNANFEINKIKSKVAIDDDEEKIDNDSYLSFFSDTGFNSNNKAFVYRWYIEGESEVSENNIKYTIIPFDEIFTIPSSTTSKSSNTKVLTDHTGNKGVMFEVKGNADVINKVYADMYKAYKSEKEDPKNDDKKIDDKAKPRLYLINNLEGLLAESEYHYINWKENAYDREDYRYKQIYNGTEYSEWADYYSKNTPVGERASCPDTLGSANLWDPIDEKFDGTIPNGDVLSYIDCKSFGSTAYSFMSKYVEKEFNYADFKELADQKNEGFSFFPRTITDTYKNNVDDPENPQLKYFWYQHESEPQAKRYLDNIIDYSFAVTHSKILNIEPNRIGGSYLNGFKQNYDEREVAPKFVDSIFGGSRLVMYLCLGFLVFLIALLVILAVLYRTTGIMSWISLMFMLSMTGLLASIGSTAISMSFLFGLFILAFAGFAAALAFGGRIRRRLYSQEDTQVIVNKALKKSLFPIIDISFITLLFGICFLYIAPAALNSLGLILTVGGFAIFIIMYLFNGGLHLLFFNNKYTIGKYSFWGKPSNAANEALMQGNNLVPTSFDATRLEFGNYSKFSRTKFEIINKKGLLAACIIGGVLLIGIVLFIVFGLVSNSLFASSVCVTIKETGDGMNILNLVKQAGLQYSSYSHLGQWWYFYCGSNQDTAIQALKSIFDYQEQLWVQNIIGATNRDILESAFLAIIIASSISALYQTARSNWTAFVPMLVGTMVSPILMLGLAAMCTVKIDETVVLGYAFIVVINTIISSISVSSINEAWNRKEAYTSNEFKFIVNTGLKNNGQLLLFTAVAYAAFILCFGLTAPFGTGWIIVLLLIGLLVSIGVTPFITSFILYFFLIIRNKALGKKAIKDQNKVNVNYDDVDEQEIEDINKFTKHKAIPKQESK